MASGPPSRLTATARWSAASQTAFPPEQENVAILADNNDQRLAIGVSDQSWHLKPATAMLVRFDNGDNWEGGSSTEHFGSNA